MKCRGFGASTAFLLSSIYYFVRLRRLFSPFVLLRSGIWTLSAFNGGSIAFSLYTFFVHNFPQLDYIMNLEGEVRKRKSISLNGGFALSCSGVHSHPQSLTDYNSLVVIVIKINCFFLRSDCPSFHSLGSL